MVNVERLKSALQAKNVTIESAAEAIGVNPSTFYRRLDRQGERFTVSEVGKLAELLNLGSRELQAIFFAK